MSINGNIICNIQRQKLLHVFIWNMKGMFAIASSDNLKVATKNLIKRVEHGFHFILQQPYADISTDTPLKMLKKHVHEFFDVHISLVKVRKAKKAKTII